MLSEIHHSVQNYAILLLFDTVLSHEGQAFAHEDFVLAMLEGPEHYLHALSLPLVAFGLFERLKALEAKVVLAEGERTHVIVLEYVPLKGPQKAPLDKHLGYLRLDGHRVQV